MRKNENRDSILGHLPAAFSRVVIARNRQGCIAMTSSSKKILLVEDMDINRVLMRKLMKGLDAELHEVQNGEMAVDYFEKGNTCDLIFMDKEMPIMDGHEATRLLRILGVKTPIIALSAGDLQSDRDLFIQAGANEYQTKLILSAAILSAPNGNRSVQGI
ncbi:Two-component response regulator ARR22 [Dendrobium catenatum]|uniref:Two-component response regulator ARR22 n=1 Tax=Dendrobium catenatum TaxID=906689 RepID=A0A2I0XIR7_9ASPA|nr:Two-component response regulator ARR22 [Dendrobium catenatum]